MNPCKSTLKCCGCMLMTQLLCLLLSLVPLLVFMLVFKFYVMDWGEDQIRKALNLAQNQSIGSIPVDVKAANNCTGCVFGNNLQWPTNTTGMKHFLDSKAGSTSTGLVATSLAAAAVTGTASMLWASFFPSAAAALSASSGFYEMTHLVEQAQFIGLIGQLELRGAPSFLYQFSKELAWTNLNFPKSGSNDDNKTRRRLFLNSDSSSKTPGETGVPHYAKMLHVEPKDLFFYTLMTFALVIAALHGLYVLWICVVSMMCKKKQTFSEIARKWYRKVIWAGIVVLLLAQYIMSMSGFFYVYNFGFNSEEKDSKYVYGLLLLIVVIGFSVLFGVLVVSTNRKELEDVGTYEHEQRPFSAKYSAYYDEYNFDNRFFFVPRILLAVITGAIVGMVTNPTTQILSILGATVVYFMLLMARAPNLLRFLFYIAVSSVFMKIVLLCLMLMLVKDDYFPQSVRNNVSYAIIGINMFVFFLMFLRQAYVTIRKLITTCSNRNSKEEDLGSDNRDQTRQPLRDRHEDSSSTPAMSTNYTRAESTGWNDMENGQAKEKFSMDNPANPYSHQDRNHAAAAAVGMIGSQRRDAGYYSDGQYSQYSNGQSSNGQFSNTNTSTREPNRMGESARGQQGSTEAVTAGVAVGAAAAGACYAHQRQNQQYDYQSPRKAKDVRSELGQSSSFDLNMHSPGKLSAYELQTIGESSVPVDSSVDTSFPMRGKLSESSSFEMMSGSSSYHESTLAAVANASVAARLSNRNMIDRRNENQSVDIDALSDALAEEPGYMGRVSNEVRESGPSDSNSSETDPNANSFVTATSAFTTDPSRSPVRRPPPPQNELAKIVSPRSMDERSYTTAEEDQSFVTFASAVSGNVNNNKTFNSVHSIDIDEDDSFAAASGTAKATLNMDASFGSTQSHETFASAISSNTDNGNVTTTMLTHTDTLDEIAIAYIQKAGETATKHTNDVAGDDAERESKAAKERPDNDVDDGLSSDDLDVDTMDHVATLERFSDESFPTGYLTPGGSLATPDVEATEKGAAGDEEAQAQEKETVRPPAQSQSSAASTGDGITAYDRSDSVQSDDDVDFYIAGRRGGRCAPPRDDADNAPNKEPKVALKL